MSPFGEPRDLVGVGSGHRGSHLMVQDSGCLLRFYFGLAVDKGVCLGDFEGCSGPVQRAGAQPPPFANTMLV